MIEHIGRSSRRAHGAPYTVLLLCALLYACKGATSEPQVITQAPPPQAPSAASAQAETNGAQGGSAERGDSPATEAPTAEARPRLAPLEPSEETLTAARALIGSRAPNVDDARSIERWLGRVGASALAGAPLVVTLPLTLRGPWGCDCPDTFVGGSTSTHGGGDTWVDAVPAPGVELPDGGRDGRVVLVEAVVTGHVGITSETDDAESYAIQVVRVLRVLNRNVGDPMPGHFRVLSLAEPPASAPCRVSASDERSALRIRASASARGESLGELPFYEEVRVVGRRGKWIQIEAPVAGYVFGPLLRIDCSTAP